MRAAERGAVPASRAEAPGGERCGAGARERDDDDDDARVHDVPHFADALAVARAATRRPTHRT